MALQRSGIIFALREKVSTVEGKVAQKTSGDFVQAGSRKRDNASCEAAQSFTLGNSLWHDKRDGPRNLDHWLR